MSDEKIIYLSPEEDLMKLRELLEEVQAKRILLVILPQTQLRSYVGWRLLHSWVRRLGKDVLVISSDPQVRAVAKAAGFRIVSSLEAADFRDAAKQASPRTNKLRPLRRSNRTREGEKGSSPSRRTLPLMPPQEDEGPDQLIEDSNQAQIIHQESQRNTPEARITPPEIQEPYGPEPDPGLVEEDPFAYIEDNPTTSVPEQHASALMEDIETVGPDIPDFPTDIEDLGIKGDFVPPLRSFGIRPRSSHPSGTGRSPSEEDEDMLIPFSESSRVILPPTHQSNRPVTSGRPPVSRARSVGTGKKFSSPSFPPRSSRPSQPKQGKNLAGEHLHFTAFHPRVVPVETWNTLPVYTYIESALQAIHDDAARLRDELGAFPDEVDVWASRLLTRGTPITIIPAFQGVIFNPERISFTWVEDWHQAKFRFQADRRWAGAAGNGEIAIYAGPLLIASLKISLQFVESGMAHVVGDSNNKAEVSAYLYKQIFTSYSHDDKSIVLACRNAYKALGFEVLIDIDKLRSGQHWNTTLMRLIDESDIFQLFWSDRSANSYYVYQECQYALQHYKGEGFIRPVYWEKPLRQPPSELSHLHFEYLELHPLKTSFMSRFLNLFRRV